MFVYNLTPEIWTEAENLGGGGGGGAGGGLEPPHFLIRGGAEPPPKLEVVMKNVLNTNSLCRMYSEWMYIIINNPQLHER